jgi:uncharacterized protein (DUF1330 family)
MTVFALAQLKFKDREAYQRYRDKFMPILMEFGGRLLAADEKPETVEEETVRALVGYRNAMTYVLRVHDDPHTHINQEFVRSLHFMMVTYDLTKLPGQWRSGPIYVVREPSNERVYEGPDYREIPQLMQELIAQMHSESGTDAMVRGALAHLNLTMIHPFKDGNGRMARAVQTLLLARDGVLSPVFCSIEEWLGRNTQAYYDILSLVGQGSWHPKNNALPWIRFCLLAHFQQAATLIKRNQEVGSTWQEIMEIVQHHGLPERCELALMDAAFGYRVRNNRYREENQISDVVASREGGYPGTCPAASTRPARQPPARSPHRECPAPGSPPGWC